MDIKVNIAILNRRFGDIVKESDSDYLTFKSWAERKDKKMGLIICEFVEQHQEESVQMKKEVIQENIDEEIAEKGGEENSGVNVFKCDQCKYVAPSKIALYGHKRRKHQAAIQVGSNSS